MSLFVSYWLFSTLPIWATALLLYIITMGAIFILRDRYEGLFYNTSWSAMIGDGALIVVVLMAAEILQRDALFLMLSPWWTKVQNGGLHLCAAGVSVMLGVIWWAIDRPKWPADKYHHLVIAPLLVYLGITLLPVIFYFGTKVECIATICLIALWVGLVVYDMVTGRLNQDRYLASRISWR